MMLNTFFLVLTALSFVATQPTIELPPNYGTYRSTISGTLTSKIHLFQGNTEGTSYAVKEFLLNNSEGEYSNILEFEIGKSLASHDHIISIFDIVYGDGSSFQIMEYIPQSLRDWVMNMDGVPTAKEAACVFRQMLDAVSYMHSNGVAHLDLKLPNVMFIGDGPNQTVKIVDFGCAVRFGGIDGKTILQQGTLFRNHEFSQS
jgi:serine/threonine protein kinase